MTPDQLKALRELASQATPGEWRSDVWIETDGNGWRATGPHHEDEASDYGSEPGCPDEQAAQRDAAFIAATCPATVIALLDQLAAMTRARDEACDIAKALHSHKCPSYETGEACQYKSHMQRIAQLRLIGSKESHE